MHSYRFEENISFISSSKAAAKQVAEGDSDELRRRQPASALSAVTSTYAQK